MKRKMNNKKIDRRIFRHTATKQKAVNVMRHVMRGGIRM